MKYAPLLLVWILVVGCSREEPIRYATYEQAMNEASEGAKWLPPFLPATSKNVVGSFDVDADQLALEFEYPAGTFDGRAFGMRVIESPAREQIIREQRFAWWSKIGKGQSLQVLEFCDGGKLGALFVDQQVGRAYYTQPAGNGPRTCSWGK